MNVEIAETTPEVASSGLAQAHCPDNDVEIKALEADRGEYLGEHT